VKDYIRVRQLSHHVILTLVAFSMRVLCGYCYKDVEEQLLVLSVDGVSKSVSARRYNCFTNSFSESPSVLMNICRRAFCTATGV
jgi:hypothetical protein